MIYLFYTAKNLKWGSGGVVRKLVMLKRGGM